MPDIGNSGLTGGTQNGPSTSDTYYGRLLQMPADGYINSVTMMLQNSSVTSNMQGFLLSATGGLTANALITSDIVTNEVTTTEKWCTVTFTTPPFLASGTYFFACGRSSDSFLLRYITGGLSTEFFMRWGESYPGIQDPDTNTGTYYSGSEIPFIYVTYTPATSTQIDTLIGVKAFIGLKSITF